MSDALRAAASGMAAQQLRIDTIANNLSNASTPGFKASRASFGDLLYRDASTGSSTAAGVRVGSGAAAVSVDRDDATGVLQETGRPTDLAIEGHGFFRVRGADGSVSYTRAGNFQLDANGRLVTPGGELLDPPVALPAGASGLTVGTDGRVGATGADGRRVELGRITLATFANPAGLAPSGDGLFTATDASGPARALEPGRGNAVLQGRLESSNVSLMTEMTSLIEAQRAFGMLSKVVSASDEMYGIANGLKR